MSLLALVLMMAVWSGMLWALATLVCRFGPSPRLAQAIWRGAALLMFAPLVASRFMPGFKAAAPQPIADLPMLEPLMVQPAAQMVVTEVSRPLPVDAGMIILGILMAGWAVRAVLWGVSEMRLQSLKSVSRRAERPIDHWVDALDLARRPRLAVTPRGAPFLAGLVHPTIYVPAAMIQGRDAQQIIVHELVHLKKGDLLTRPLERLAADLVWFSPFAWAMRERLDYWREAVVDEAAAELTGDRIAYARALTRAARLARPVTTLPVAAFILKKEGTLKMRLKELLSDTQARPKRLGLAMAAALALATPLALAQGALIKGAAAPLQANAVYTHAVLDQARVTSTFGLRPHPIDKTPGWHNGVDLALAEGEPVYAPADGVISFAGPKGGYGTLIQLDISETVRMRFGQLSQIDVEVGDVVKAGDVIGLVGQSGRATGPHLHLEVWHDEKPHDPMAEEGLVLAEVLEVPEALQPPKAPAATTPPAHPAAPAPAAPEKAVAPGTPPQPVAAPAPPKRPEACVKASEWLARGKRPESWTARRDAAKAANLQAGIVLPTGSEPFAVKLPTPYYPAEAATKTMSGACDVLFDLGTDGTPKNMQAACSDPVFEASAAEMKGARFEPIKGPDGKPVEVKGLAYPIEYCIEG